MVFFCLIICILRRNAQTQRSFLHHFFAGGIYFRIYVAFIRCSGAGDRRFNRIQVSNYLTILNVNYTTKRDTI